VKSNDFNKSSKEFYNEFLWRLLITPMNIGLPSGPIAMPDITALEAVNQS
jgi:UPF0755 protein